jgi:Protein of unknown function (DUF3349)
MPLPPLLQSIVDFVRKGYPQGVPQQDYLPLFALLSRRLSDAEIAELAEELASAGPDPRTSAALGVSLGAAIERLTHVPPSETEVERVRERLEAVGWQPESETGPEA